MAISEDENSQPINPDGNLVSELAVRLSNDFGQRIAFLCAKFGITIYQLEVAVGFSKGSLNSIVSGRRAGRLTAWTAVLVADALGVEIGLLLTGRPHDSSLRRINVNDDSSWPPPLPALARRFDPSKRKAVAPKTRKKKPQR